MKILTTHILPVLLIGALLCFSCHSASVDDARPSTAAADAKPSQPSDSTSARDGGAAQADSATHIAVPTQAKDATREGAPTQPKDATHGGARVVRITAKRFEYSPASISLKKGEPVVLELVSLDRVHGFNAPDFKLRSDVKPNEITRLEFTPDRAGTFEFHCDVFCGSGHEDMSGEFVVHD
jgi:cytochrome c oxidase subunit II